MGWGNEQPLVQLKRDAADRKRLADENDRLRAELAELQAQIEATRPLSEAATQGEWAVYFNHHADAFLVTGQNPEDVHDFEDYVTRVNPSREPDDYGRANALLIAAAVNLVRSALSVAATDTGETP